MQNKLMSGGAVVVVAGSTDTGEKRDHNEDSFFLDAEIGLIAVADGLGGQQAGEVASAIVTRVLGTQIRRRLLAIAGERIHAVVLESEVLDLIVRSALVDAHAEVAVVEKRMQARDHPVLMTVPETYYLKCFILRKLA